MILLPIGCSYILYLKQQLA